jgi:hypothetical protein
MGDLAPVVILRLRFIDAWDCRRVSDIFWPEMQAKARIVQALSAS